MLQIGTQYHRKISKIITRASNDPTVFTITEKAPSMAFSRLKVPRAVTFKKLYAKRALTQSK